MPINGQDLSLGDIHTATGSVAEEFNAAASATCVDLAGQRSPVDPDGRRAFWQLSFAGPEGWRGCFQTAAPSFQAALGRATVLGANPGGEVVGIGFRAFGMADYWLDRLLTDADEIVDMPAPAGIEALR